MMSGTPMPVPASTFLLSPDETEQLDSYGRSSNPSWRQLESALAELEGAAGAGAAVASTQQDASRRTPEVGRSTEDLMIEQHNVFDRALTVDVGGIRSDLPLVLKVTVT